MPILGLLELIVNTIKTLWQMLVNCHPFTDVDISLAAIVAGLILFDIFWKILGVGQDGDDDE